MLNVLNCLVNKDVSLKNKCTLFNTVSTPQALSAQNVEEINNLIIKIKVLSRSSESKAKSIGLTWLLKLLTSCSNNTFQSHWKVFLQLGVDILEGSNNMFNTNRAFCIVQAIIKRMTKSDMDYNIVSLIHKVLIKILNTSSEDEPIHSLKCLAVILEKMPAECKSSKDSIENFLNKHFDAADAEEIEMIALCMSRLPASSEIAAYSQSWTNQFDKLLNTLDCIIDFFTRNLGADIEGKIIECYELPSSSEDPLFGSLSHYRYFHTLAVCGAKMLDSDIPYVQLPARKLLVFVENTFNFIHLYKQRLHVANNKMAEEESSYLPSIFQDIQKDLLFLLEALVLCCPNVLLNHQVPITRLLLKELEATKEVGSVPSCSDLRSYIYRILIIVLTKTNESCLRDRRTSLVEILVSDILLANNGSKNQHGLSVDIKNPAYTAVPNDDFYNAVKRTNCQEALRVLSTFVCKCQENKVQAKLVQEVTERILEILGEFSFQQSFPSPYDDETCRRSLYNLLLTIILRPHLNNHRQISVALHMFQNGVADKIIEISHFCNWASSVCRSVIHSSKPSMPAQILEPTPSKYVEVSNKDILEIDGNTSWSRLKSLEFTIEQSDNESDNEMENPMVEINMRNIFDKQENSQSLVVNHNNIDDMDEIEDEEKSDHPWNWKKPTDEDDLENEDTPEEDMDEDEIEDEELEEEEEEEEEEVDEEDDYSIEDIKEDQAVDEVCTVGSPSEHNYHSPDKPEKKPVDNGYLPNGTAASSEDEKSSVPYKESSKKRPHDFHSESPSKKKHTETEMEDGTLDSTVSSGEVPVNMMLADFSDVPPEDNKEKLQS